MSSSRSNTTHKQDDGFLASLGGGPEGHASNSNSILTGLNSFGAAQGEEQDAESTIHDSNWAEELALWTNANFSFDAPMGHALLLDEEKDGGDEGGATPSGSNAARNNASGSRDQSAHPGDIASRPPSSSNNPLGPHSEPTHREQKSQADHLQQSQYFGPPTAAAGEGRRPGWNPNSRDELSRRRAENDTPNGTAGADGQALLGSGPSSVPFAAGQNAFSAFSGDNNQPSQQQQQQQQQQQSDAALQHLAPFFDLSQMSPELLQGVALQHLLHVNQPFGVNDSPFAGMGSNSIPAVNAAGASSGPSTSVDGNSVNFAGLNAANFGTSLYHMPQQPQTGAQQQQQQQQHQQQQQQLQQQAEQLQQQAQQSESPTLTSQLPASGDRSDDVTSKVAGKRRRQSSKGSDDNSDSGGQDPNGSLREDNIPPLKLIDTGNPEADAEANRVAIEEDKRRRNTAASARFRIKKKQREQALEQTTKQLESRVRSLEEENKRLNTENGWLKSLITIRPGAGPTGSTTNAASPASNGAMTPQTQQQHTQLNPFQQFATANAMLGSGLQPKRDTGLQPRGVGTINVAAPTHHVQQQRSEARASQAAHGGPNGVHKAKKGRIDG